MKNLGAKILLLITIVVTLLVIHSTRERRFDSSNPAQVPSRQQQPKIPAQGSGTGSKSITQPAWIRGSWEETASENHHFPSIQQRTMLFPGVFPA